VYESTFRIFRSLRDSLDYQWLYHCDGHDHVEHTGEQFRPSVDCREVTGTGGLFYTAQGIEPRRHAYPVVAKDTALRWAAFKSSVRTKIIAPSVYGDYVDDSGRVVKANVDSRRDRKPPHSHFVGAPMPYFLEFAPGYGLHPGYLPGVPASHGCIRMRYWKSRQFYNAAHVGTVVLVKN
jgi:lipoprotein-anchoring transpeptidase ErfK/SrfK